MADAKLNHDARRPGIRAARGGALAALLLTAFVALPACKEEPEKPETIQVKIGDETFDLELALTAHQRYRGLSDRRSIPADGGMLFAFRQPRKLGFVMRRCYVPIDIIYLDARGRIGKMHRMKVEPYDTPEDELPTYPSVWDAQFAIELAGGSLDRLKLEPGQQIELPYEDLKKRAQ